jgi:hypothetical protein
MALIWHGQKHNLYCSTNKMSPNMPINIFPNRFYLKKRNYEEIRWPFIIKLSHVEETEAGKNKYDASAFLIVS